MILSLTIYIYLSSDWVLFPVKYYKWIIMLSYKSLQLGITDMKLKDAYSLEREL